MDDASKRSAPTLLMGTPDTPRAGAPQAAPASPRTAAAAKPRAKARRTIRGAVSSAPPAAPPTRRASGAPSVVIDDPALSEPDLDEPPPSDELTRPVFTAVALPPLPLSRASAVTGSFPPSATRRASPWPWVLVAAACIALFAATFTMRRAPGARAPARAVAPTSPAGNVSLIYDAASRAP